MNAPDRFAALFLLFLRFKTQPSRRFSAGLVALLARPRDAKGAHTGSIVLTLLADSSSSSSARARRKSQKPQIPVCTPRPTHNYHPKRLEHPADQHRYERQLRIHIQQRRPHTRQHPARASAKGSACHIRRLQECDPLIFPSATERLTGRCIAVPHPLFATFELRIQTDGTMTPKEALVSCCKALVGDMEILSREFTKEYELRKMVSGDAGGDH